MIALAELPSTVRGPAEAVDGFTLRIAADALAARGFDVAIARSGEEAREAVLDRTPGGAEVHTGSSVTLRDLGITAEVEESGRYLPVRPRTMAMDRFTQSADIRRLVSTPDVFLASAQAVTEDGRVLIASGSGSQIGPIASGAGRVILVVGAQKVVRDLDEAFRRLEDYVLPLEDVRAMAAYGRPASVNQTLVLHGGGGGRIAVVLVAEPIGI